MTFYQRWVWPAGGSGGIWGDVVGTLLWVVIAAVVTGVLYPPLRHAIIRFFKGHFESVHDKLDAHHAQLVQQAVDHHQEHLAQVAAQHDEAMALAKKHHQAQLRAMRRKREP